METAIFAAGCFWCIEAVFNQLKGVQSATSGYINGHTTNPSYEQVCTGETGHAEAVQVVFNPQIISYATLLAVLFAIHDPTQHNRQGHDVGTQYRSGIYYRNNKQKAQAEAFLAQAAPHYSAPLATEVAPAQTFYPAEDYHQGYFLKHPNTSYCMAVVKPKYLKAQVQFADLWKA